jgi:superoxide dismutase, Cu-Zn family
MMALLSTGGTTMLRRHMIGMLVLLGCATVSGQPQLRATAKMINAAGATVGTATLTPTIRGGVLINITLNRLPAGTHALHIHTVGKCDAPDFASAGPHFNPEMKEHGTANPKGAHAGDLPNVEFLGRGQDDVSIATGDVTLAPGPNSLFHPGGTALVIHANADDNKTDPAGNAGARIACGVIEKAGS